MRVKYLAWLKRLCIGVHFILSGVHGQLIGSEAVNIFSPKKLCYQGAEECLEHMNLEQLHIILNVLYLASKYAIEKGLVKNLNSFYQTVKKDVQLAGGDYYGFYRKDTSQQAPARKDAFRQVPVRKYALHNIINKKAKDADVQMEETYNKCLKLDSYVRNLDQSITNLIMQFDNKSEKKTLAETVILYQKAYDLLQKRTIDPRYYTLFSFGDNVTLKENGEKLPPNLSVPVYSPVPKRLIKRKQSSASKKNKRTSQFPPLHCDILE